MHQTTTVHFTPVSNNDNHARLPNGVGKNSRRRPPGIGKPSEQPEPSRFKTFDLYAALRRDTETLEKLVRGLPLSGDRHGDLQSMLSTALRIPDKLKALLATEED